MIPLIDRLRHGCGDPVRDTALMSEAADEIERLRADNARLFEVFREMAYNGTAYRHVAHFRRRAAALLKES